MTICDPACGTGGFLLAIYNYLSDPKRYQLDRSQKKRLATETLYGVELVDGVQHVVERLVCVMRGRRYDLLDRDDVANQPAITARSTNDVRPRFVHDDAREPGDEASGIPAVRQCAIRANERRLQNVLGLVAAADHAHHEPRVPVAITPTQCGEGTQISVDRRSNELPI